MFSDKKILLLLIVFFLAGFAAGHLFLLPNGLASPDCDYKENFSFLNPSIACNLSEEENLEMVDSLKQKIEKYISVSKTEKKISRASVFFRDLSSKKWVGINHNEKYAPASLLKLPLLISYFKLSESDASLLSKKNVFKKTNVFLHQNFASSVELEEGKEYTVEELLRHMIVYSDNCAMNFLVSLIDEGFLKEQYYQLGISLDYKEEDDLSAVSYSNLLRTLYNSSYLKRESSQKILQWLSESDFKEGLSNGIPSEIKVAHKFGERDFSSSLKELHDCGIIYYSDHPYILCVMTAGSNFDDLKELISDISLITYQEVIGFEND